MSCIHPFTLLTLKDNEVLIEKESLEKLLKHEELKNRALVVLSIIGFQRKEKPIILNYYLRYLYAHYPSINYPNNPIINQDAWMRDELNPMIELSWILNSNQDTTSMIAWNDVFLHTSEVTGERLAIIVLDTQKLFDNQTSRLNNSMIFTFGTLISSIQVLNLSNQIQEDHLQYIQFVNEFTNRTLSESASKPFQNLIFLIREWAFLDIFVNQYGLKVYFRHKLVMKRITFHVHIHTLIEFFRYENLNLEMRINEHSIICSIQCLYWTI